MNPPFIRAILASLVSLLALLGCSDQAKLAGHLRDAERHFESRDFERAKIEYMNVLRLENTNSVAIQRLGKIYFAQGQAVQAYPFLARARVLFPDDLQLREHLVAIYSRAGETNRSLLRQELAALLERDPTNETGVLVLADAARTEPELQDLDRQLRELRAKAGDRPIFHLADAERARKRGDTNACEASLRQAIAMDPNLVIAHQAYGSFLAGQGRAAEAQAQLQTAAEIAAPHSPAREQWARFLFQNRRVAEAKTVLDEVNAKAPERVSGWVLRAEIALMERNHEETEKILARALSKAPLDPEALRVLAQLRLAQNKPAEAIRELEKLLQQQPRMAQNHYQLGLAYLLNQDMARAIGSFEKASELDPDFVSAPLLLAELNIARGQGADAIGPLTELARRRPDLEQIDFQLIRAYRSAGRVDEALSAALAARKKYPQDAAVAFQTGLVLREKGKPLEAQAAFEDVLKLSTNRVPAIEQLVELDVQRQDIPGALQRVARELETVPNSPAYWLMRGQVLVAQKDDVQAEVALRKVLELDPTSRPALLALSELYVRTHRQKEAIAGLEELIKKQPGEIGALTLLGMLYSDAGELEKARASYESAIKAQPNSPLLLNNLAYLLAERLGKVDVAYEHALKARQLAPEEAVISDTLGWIEFRRGQYQEALRLLTEASEKLGAIPEVQFHLGMTYYRMGQEAQARSALQAAVAGTADFPGKDSAREHLALLQAGAGKIDDQALRALEKRSREAPDDLVALARLAAAYESTGAFDKARDTYEAALKVNPKAVNILSALATLYAQRHNQPARALELARNARNLAPADPSVAYAAGRVAFVAGDQAWAYSLLQESARHLTNRPDVTLSLAWAAYSQGRVEDAERLLQGVAKATSDPVSAADAMTFLSMIDLVRKPVASPTDAALVQNVLNKDPAYGPALMAYGLLAEQQGRYKEAQEAYDRVLGRFPAFTPAIRQLAILFAERLDNDAKANELGLKARQAFPRDDVLAAALGKVVTRRGDYRHAVQLLTEAARTRTTDASLYYHLGLAQQGLKESAASKAALEKALALDPGAPFAPDATKRLAALRGG